MEEVATALGQSEDGVRQDVVQFVTATTGYSRGTDLVETQPPITIKGHRIDPTLFLSKSDGIRTAR